ncbi:hypothetical protein H257_08316 [Aphanomyces astaci]|uniref:Uncharacterized protein n=1 Tax=Aphanomyces astaci TaxID=112090 RepID=W4GFT6_APHAT|nr:hypothetical protein H257_08316 [Aphanomyces astaci]ETV78111.1 hypothetical protein H257_08316 [Aphanomyces astaci]|eukprot:XP_009832448.1 hypothetical protein H257_08316 [Aphanomyces astaci]
MPQQTNMSPKVASARIHGKKHLTLAQRHRIYELLLDMRSRPATPWRHAISVAVHPHAMAGVLPISRRKLQETLVAKERVLRTRLKPQSAKSPKNRGKRCGHWRSSLVSLVVKRKYFVYEDEELAARFCKSKHFITKVMFLAAVVRPRYDFHRKQMFDGKIGVWPFGLLWNLFQPNGTAKTVRKERLLFPHNPSTQNNEYKLPHMKKDASIANHSSFHVECDATSYESALMHLNNRLAEEVNFEAMVNSQEQVI